MHVRMVLETLRHHKLYAKASKCPFGRSSVGFLGHFISERGVAVDPRQVTAVTEWAAPSSCAASSTWPTTTESLCSASPPSPPR